MRDVLARFACIAAAVLLALPANAAMPVPPPKRMDVSPEVLDLRTVELTWADAFAREAGLLERSLRDAGTEIAQGGTPVALVQESPDFPPLESRHRDEILRQGYGISIGDGGVVLRAADSQGMFYAVRTFEQLLDGTGVRHARILDWPDIPLRMIMIDPARQNENMDYYRRVIDFAADYGINAVLCHLTDDQTSALFHEDYPALMHEHAWTPEEVRALVAYAKERHIDLIPEIESLGHSRMFTRMEDYGRYLHQTIENLPDQSWMGTDIEGYTNVLCPASDAAAEYLDAMYGRASETFGHSWIHIGFDEVDMTECARCIAKYGGQSPGEWMSAALVQAGGLVAKHGAKTALWGDMLLAHPEVMESLSPDDTIVFDWHYGETVDPSSVAFFADRGFQVVASPALACAPHMNMPDVHNYRNIANFARIARENDLLGINTTVWVPVRYMSDAMWTGIAFAAAHSWGGSGMDDREFAAGFAKDYFGTDMGDAFHGVWNSLAETVWHRNDFNTACWIDEESLEEAKDVALAREAELLATRDAIDAVLLEIDAITPSVSRHREEWRRFGDSARVLRYNLEHLLAAPRVGGADTDETVAALDAQCTDLIAAIERDWDRNRFSGDPGKEGRFLQNQHLLFRFRQMHDFHQRILTGGLE